MRKLIVITLFAVLLAHSGIAYGHEPIINDPVFAGTAQPDDPWPGKSESVSAYLSFPVDIHLNLSYNYLKNTGTFFHGVSSGISIMGVDGVTFGPHLTYSMMFGRGDHHLDARFGAALPFDPDVTFMKVVPVVSLAYRHQKPGSKKYFRAGINTGGIGVGWGWIIDREK